MIWPRKSASMLVATAFGGVAYVFAGMLWPVIAAADEKPAEAPPASDASKPGDTFGEEITLTGKTIVYFKGNGTWDAAFDTITDGFKTVLDFLDKAGIKPTGSLMTIYTSTDDTGFQFQAAVPVAEAPKDLPAKGNIAVGKSPEGRAFKFVHHGSYDSMDMTYDAITNFLDAKGLDAKETFIEEYVTDPLSTPEDKLVVTIYIPVPAK
jgi:effector-binding domain-containing protein